MRRLLESPWWWWRQCKFALRYDLPLLPLIRKINVILTNLVPCCCFLYSHLFHPSLSFILFLHSPVLTHLPSRSFPPSLRSPILLHLPSLSFLPSCILFLSPSLLFFYVPITPFLQVPPLVPILPTPLPNFHLLFSSFPLTLSLFPLLLLSSLISSYSFYLFFSPSCSIS